MKTSREHMTRVMRLAIGATALMAAAVIAVGCGSSDDGNGNGDGDGGGGGGGEVTFAALLPLTGPNASYGEFQVNGAQMAVDEINAEGGIGGETKLNLVIEDSQADPEETVTAFNRAYGDHEMPVAISVGSSSILALVPLAEQRKVMLLNGGSQGDELAGASDLLFSTLHLIKNEVEVLAPYIADKGFERAAILYIDDDLGRAGKDDFTEDFEEAGGEVVGTAAHKPGGTDFRSQLASLRNSNPDVLFIASYGEDAHIAIDQARQLGWDIQVAGPSLVALPDIIKDKDADGLITTPIEFNPSKEFAAEYRKRNGSAPEHPFVGTYFDAVKVAAEAYEYAVENDLGTDGEGIAEAVRQIGTFDTSFGGQITFGDDGVAERDISVAEVKNGKAVVEETE